MHRWVDDAASDLAVMMGGEMLGSTIAIAEREGYRVRCQLSSLSGVTQDGETEIEIGIPIERPLALWIARGNPLPEDVAAGNEVDIVVGVPSFDDVFHVEGAPVDVVRGLFPPETCAALARLPEPILSTVNVDGRPTLRLRLKTWNGSDVIRGVDAALRVIGRMRDAYDEADAVFTHDANPYRNETTARARIDDQREADFRALRKVRRAKVWWRRFQRALRRFTSRRRDAEPSG